MFFVKLLLRPLYYCRPCLSRYYSSRWLWQEEYVLSLVMSGSVSGRALQRIRSIIATLQVGFSGEDLRHYMPYSSDFRRRSPAKNRTCDARWGDLRHKMGNQHNQRGDLRQKVFSLRPPLPPPSSSPSHSPLPAALALGPSSLPPSRTPGSASETLRNTLIN